MTRFRFERPRSIGSIYRHFNPSSSFLLSLTWHHCQTYDGDARDLCLTYVVADETLPGSGSNIDVELVPGGAKMEVTQNPETSGVNPETTPETRSIIRMGRS